MITEDIEKYFEGKTAGMEESLLACIGRYLETKDLTIIERGYTCEVGTCDFIMQDRETHELVFAFASVSSHPFKQFDIESHRQEWEQIAMRYLFSAENDFEGDIRFDKVSVQFNGNNLFVRYHRNALGRGWL